MNSILRKTVVAAGYIAFLLAAAPASAQTRQPLRADGLEIFFGVIPAEIVLGHPGDHAERKMHGGVPSGGGQHHLLVSLFDARNAARLTDATVEATVSEPGLSVSRKRLEPMTFGGTITFGNYFNMPAAGPYQIELAIRLTGRSRPIDARFEYYHPRR